MVGSSPGSSLPGCPPVRLPRRVSGGTLECRLYMGRCPVCRRPVQIRITGAFGTAQCRCGRESFGCWLPPIVWHAQSNTRLTVVASPDSAPVLEFLIDLDIAPPLLRRMRDACPHPLSRSSVLPARLSALMVGFLIQHWKFRNDGRPEPWRIQSLRSGLWAGLRARLCALGTRLRRARSALLRNVAEGRSLHRKFLAHLIVFDPTNLPVRLERDDLELASCWPMKPRESQEKHRERTRAARAAERATAYYYSVLFPGSRIVDVALGQIRTAPRSIWSWQDCDLDRDGIPVDVKNVRQVPRRGAGVYAEWFAKDKSTDGLSSEIVIAATITRPCGSGATEPPRFESSLIGEWTPVALADLQEWTSPFPELPLTWTGRPTRPGHLSGWLLEFPAAHYRSLTAELASACVEVWKSVGESAPPLWFAAFVVARGATGTRDFTDREDPLERYFLQSLAPMRHGLPTRPRLVLFSVAWLLAAIVHRDFSAAFDVLSRALWGPSGSEDTGLWRYPLGLDDPQQYVRTWIETIGSIAPHALDILRGVRAVRLLGSGILRVCFDDERDERTLVAYCHACATRPLLFGQDRDCGCSERRLRCECGGCKPGCVRDRGDWRYWLNRSGNYGDGSV